MIEDFVSRMNIVPNVKVSRELVAGTYLTFEEMLAMPEGALVWISSRHGDKEPLGICNEVPHLIKSTEENNLGVASAIDGPHANTIKMVRKSLETGRTLICQRADKEMVNLYKARINTL